MITPQHWEKAISYKDYRNMIDALMAEGKTTGEKQTPELLAYAKLNIQRMNRLDKTATVLPALEEKIKHAKPQKWLILTEGWCGDAAQNLPILIKIAELAPQIEVRFLLRDENLDIMDLYLTNGGRSIPKLIALSADGQELFNWGPRPLPAQEFLIELKKTNPPFDVLAEKLHKWYADDKNQHLQEEILALL